MPLLFAVTLFTSALLLFVVQPMVANMLLPLLGGAPAVWTTCMVFYQVLLLLGYLYAHLLSKIRSHRVQVVVQLTLLVAAYFTLPFARTEEMENSVLSESHPTAWLLAQLLLLVGLPFFIASTNGPLLQRWFSFLRHEDSKDPYFLYSASNLGSLIALLGYPIWLEPTFDLPTQSNLWQWSFGGLIVLIVGCAFVYARPRLRQDPAASPDHDSDEAAETISWRRRSYWVLLSFVPSSLLLGVTTYLTTDIASVPLLWVIPLSLYLFSFVLVFARREYVSQKFLNRSLPVLGIILIFALLCRATEPVLAVLLIHMGFFFNAIMVAHGRLAADRPSPARLTEFYFWMSLGGALGGIFNAVVAPAAFNEVLEYPISILLACALYCPIAAMGKPGNTAKWPFYHFLAVSAVAVLVVFLVPRFVSNEGLAAQVLIFGVPVILCYPLTVRPGYFASALVVVMVVGQIHIRNDKRILFVDRSFFGVSRVSLTKNGKFRQLDHGTTAHGRQFVDPKRQCEPLAYYHQEGPLGKIMSVFNQNHPDSSVGLIGLGAGAALTYSMPDQDWDIYEIDPLVIQIATDAKLFSYLSECSAVVPRIIEGDARLQLQRTPDARYKLLILDAFSSDAIPTHLLTREAMDLYFQKIATDGWLVMHISNRYLNLEQIIAGAAKERGDYGLIWFDTATRNTTEREESHWVILSRREGNLKELLADPNRIPLESRPTLDPWTDNRSSILPLFKW